MPIPALFRWLAITPLLLVGLSSRLHAAESENTPPNIIFILTDDQRDNTFGAMGHPVIQTPHLDALMAESMRFRNAYAPTPVCAPSRISYLTGMPERLHGVGFSSSYVLTAEQWEQTYPAVLRRHGYYTGFVGKFGVEYYTFKGKADQKFDYWWGHDGWTKFLPKDHDEASTRPYHRAQADTIPAIMAEAMTEFLDSTPSDQPFCLSVSLNVPHGSQATSMFTDYEGWHSMTRPANENPQLQGTPFYDELYRHTDLSLPADALTDPYRFIPEFIQDQDAGRRNNTTPTTTTLPPCASTTSATSRSSRDSTKPSENSAPSSKTAASIATPSSSTAAITACSWVNTAWAAKASCSISPPRFPASSTTRASPLINAVNKPKHSSPASTTPAPS